MKTKHLVFCLAIIVLLAAVVLPGCSKEKPPPLVTTVIAPSSGPDQPDLTKIRFEGKVLNPPAIFKSQPFKFKFRVYSCPADSAGDASHSKKPQKCMMQCYEATAESRDGSYSLEMPVGMDWTHGFVELVNTDEIAGMYSPGHNPFWFRNAPDQASEKAVLKHNFEFKSQENPILDSVQEEMAAKFAPIIVVKAGKKYIPTNLEKYAKTVKLASLPAKDDDIRRLRGSVSDDAHMILEQGLEPGDTHLYYHVRYADTFVSGTQTEALPGWRDDTNYRYNKGNGDMVVSYWLWYDRNEGPTSFGNVHQGDIESFALLIDKDGNAKRFMVTGHDHIMLDTAWTNINSVNNHPIIYVAHGNKGSDGGNPTSGYGGYEVLLEAGNAVFNALTDPRDIFPELSSTDSEVIIPNDMDVKSLTAVMTGPGTHIDQDATAFVDISQRIRGVITKLVKWEEPGWINKTADTDPDGHHRVDKAIAPFLGFDGRIGMHPRSSLKLSSFTQFGRSPENAPFKTNIEQHYTFEHPRIDRAYSGRLGDYGPKFTGDDKTPQFIK